MIISYMDQEINNTKNCSAKALTAIKKLYTWRSKRCPTKPKLCLTVLLGLSSNSYFWIEPSCLTKTRERDTPTHQHHCPLIPDLTFWMLKTTSHFWNFKITSDFALKHKNLQKQKLLKILNSTTLLLWPNSDFE
jgi:hypothetical protein